MNGKTEGLGWWGPRGAVRGVAGAALIAAGVVVVGSVGCGGDICSADISSAAGTYKFSFGQDGDALDSITISIDDNGNVHTVDPTGKIDPLGCDVVSSDFCDLQVHCTEADGKNGFTFLLQKL